MTPPIDQIALAELITNLPPERDDPFPHLADLTADELLCRRVEISGKIKSLEEERQQIDAELQSIYSDNELRHGIRANGGWLLSQRSRTSWSYTSDVRAAIKSIQKQAQRDGRAEPLVSTYLYLTQESSKPSIKSISR
jgi:hypothetical protein